MLDRRPRQRHRTDPDQNRLRVQGFSHPLQDDLVSPSGSGFATEGVSVVGGIINIDPSVSIRTDPCEYLMMITRTVTAAQLHR